MSIFKPIVYRPHYIEDVEIHLWQLTENLEDLCGLLSDGSILAKEPYITFKSDKRKREWVAVRVLLEQVCSQTVAICYEQSGKPYLNPRIANFSVSHTKDVVGIALSKQPIGIDLEQISERPLRLASHFINPNDSSPIYAPDPELMATFMWSAKESVYKLLGVPGIELFADIYLKLSFEDKDYIEFLSQVPRLQKQSIVRCYRCGTFVLTIATFLN